MGTIKCEYTTHLALQEKIKASGYSHIVRNLYLKNSTLVRCIGGRVDSSGFITVNFKKIFGGEKQWKKIQRS